MAVDVGESHRGQLQCEADRGVGFNNLEGRKKRPRGRGHESKVHRIRGNTPERYLL